MESDTVISFVNTFFMYHGLGKKVDSLYEAIDCCKKTANKSEIIPHIYGKHLGLEEHRIDFRKCLISFLKTHFIMSVIAL